jgi:hypothetical protein
MPITEKNGKWYWGEQGPYDTKEAAQRVATAAYLSGYKKKTGVMPKKKPYRGKFIRDGKIVRKNEDPTEKSKQWLIDTVERAYPQITRLDIFTNVDGGSYIVFNCHNLTWFVELTKITWIAPFGNYVVCVLNDDKYGATALYDKLLTKIDVIANQTFEVVPVLEFAWGLYQLDLAYPEFYFNAKYYTPIKTSGGFIENYNQLKGFTQKNSRKAAWEKLELVRELYHQIFGGNLR